MCYCLHQELEHNAVTVLLLSTRQRTVFETNSHVYDTKDVTNINAQCTVNYTVRSKLSALSLTHTHARALSRQYWHPGQHFRGEVVQVLVCGGCPTRHGSTPCRPTPHGGCSRQYGSKLLRVKSL